jgi:hypothetical protein
MKPGLVRRHAGHDGDDRRPERGKVQGGIGRGGTCSVRHGTDRLRGRSPGAAAGDTRTAIAFTLGWKAAGRPDETIAP